MIYNLKNLYIVFKQFYISKLYMVLCKMRNKCNITAQSFVFKSKYSILIIFLINKINFINKNLLVL